MKQLWGQFQQSWIFVLVTFILILRDRFGCENPIHQSSTFQRKQRSNRAMHKPCTAQRDMSRNRIRPRLPAPTDESIAAVAQLQPLCDMLQIIIRQRHQNEFSYDSIYIGPETGAGRDKFSFWNMPCRRRLTRDQHTVWPPFKHYSTHTLTRAPRTSPHLPPPSPHTETYFNSSSFSWIILYWI